MSWPIFRSEGGNESVEPPLVNLIYYFCQFLKFFFFVIIVGFPFINKGVVVFCVSYHLGYCLLSTAALNLELMSKSTGGRVLQLIFECYKVIQKTGKRFFFLIPAHCLDCVFLEFFHQGFHYHCHLRAEHLSPCGVRALHAFAGP